MLRGGRETHGIGTLGKGLPMGVARIGSTLARLKMRPGRGQTLGTVGMARGLVKMREIVVRDLVMVLEFEIA